MDFRLKEHNLQFIQIIHNGLICIFLEFNGLPFYNQNSHRNILLDLQCLIELEESNILSPKINESHPVNTIKS